MFSLVEKDSFSWKTCGFLGTLPSLNYDAVKKGIKLAYALNADVNYKNIRFERKNYFYFDLPQGYQITQYFNPIGRHGYIFLKNNKKINIRQIHLEEDTAQQSKKGHSIGLSFSRLGQALIEIVTEPDFTSYEEIDDFLKRLRWICLLLGVSDASYSKGEMRVDLNISLRDNNLKTLSAKSEVKNLNSCEAIEKSMIYLFNKKQELLQQGKEIQSYTYAWVEKLEKCEIMRKKGNFKTYFYIPEANIPQLVITEEEYQEIVKDADIDLLTIINRLEKGNLEEKEIFHLLNNTRLLNEVFELSEKIGNLSSSYNWMVNVVSGLVNRTEDKSYSYKDIEQTIINFEITKKLNQKQTKLVLKEIIINKSSYKKALKNLRIEKLLDDDELMNIISKIFEENESQLADLSHNIPKLERFIMGECMKRTEGQADPKKAKCFLDETLKRYFPIKKI